VVLFALGGCARLRVMGDAVLMCLSFCAFFFLSYALRLRVVRVGNERTEWFSLVGTTYCSTLHFEEDTAGRLLFFFTFLFFEQVQ
jgi:hypothetical protein